MDTGIVPKVSFEEARHDKIMKHGERFIEMSAIVVFAEGGF